MTDDIRTLTARLAEEPGSLAFLELGEALRRRGQLEAAHKVARGGVSRHPGLADAHDLVARILADQGDLRGAFVSWTEALRLDPLRASAHKGVAFIYFRAGDAAAALDHLERALEADPDDDSVPLAIQRVRNEIVAAHGTSAGATSEAAPTPDVVNAIESDAPKASANALATDAVGKSVADVVSATDMMSVADAASPASAEFTPGDGVLLCDGEGLRLAGGLRGSSDGARADAAAAELAGVSKEAARTARLLGLGAWQSIAIESPDGNLVLVPPMPDTILLAAREPGLPMARLALLAERAARDARAWLEGQQR